MNKKLEDYVEGRISYTPIMNLMINNRSKDWYAELGRYIVEQIDINKIPYLSYYTNVLKENGGLITKIKEFIKSDDMTYSSISVSFLTGVLDEKSLENMFGKPILHNEFGEGFDGDYDDMTDTQTEPNIKESYASYFVNIDGVDFHIGYDHRGVSIEIDYKYNFSRGGVSDSTAQWCLDSVKKIVDLYKKRNVK